MRIGIVTFHAAINYGAALQVFALTRFLKQQGHQPEIINYCPIPDLQGKFRNRFAVFGLFPSDYLNAYKGWAFRRFQSQHLPIRGSMVTDAAELPNLPRYDAYICGSDQIWNAKLTGGQLDPAYFLSFAPTDVPRIAYAGSTGSDRFANEEDAAALLGGLTALSVREAALKPTVERLSGKAALHVVDPTLLPVDYSQFEGAAGRGYILLYALQASEHIYENARRLQKLTGLPIINLGTRVNPWKHPGRQVCGSPTKYLELFANARLVITNSFHGTVFSTIFRKPFFSCSLVGQMQSRNTRITGILEPFGLMGRFIPEGERISSEDLERARSIDWAAVGEKRDAFQADSVDFLTGALGGTF